MGSFGCPCGAKTGDPDWAYYIGKMVRSPSFFLMLELILSFEFFMTVDKQCLSISTTNHYGVKNQTNLPVIVGVLSCLLTLITEKFSDTT